MAKQEVKKEAKKKFLKSVKFDGLPVAKVGDEVTEEYKAAVAKLSKEELSKYVG